MTATRTETDSIGPVEVPADAYWGAQTQRSLENFPFGARERMPIEIVHALALVKQAAARVNRRHGLEAEKAEAIEAAAAEVAGGKLDDQFPLAIWQTGSGTQTNMNVNEVIAGRAARRRSTPTTTSIAGNRRTTASLPRSTSPAPSRCGAD